MPIKRKFLLGLLLLTAVVAASTLIVVRAFREIAVQRALTEQANELSIAALEFNVENFHTQLEVWEYAYAPNQERLAAVRKHEATFDTLFAALLTKASSVDAPLSEGARGAIDLLQSHIPVLKASWEPIVDAIQRQLPEQVIREAVLGSEAVFDSYQFNKNVAAMVVSQERFVADTESALNALIQARLILVVVLSLFMLASFLLFYWWFSTGVLAPIVEFTAAADAISRGRVVAPPKIDRQDEVGALADAFARMVAAVRFLISESAPEPVAAEEEL